MVSKMFISLVESDVEKKLYSMNFASRNSTFYIVFRKIGATIVDG